MTTAGTVNITPNYDRLREWMLGVWRDPTQGSFRRAVKADPTMLRWLAPVCFEPVTPHDDLVCHRLIGHFGPHRDWAPDECLVDGCACTEQEES